MQAHLLSLLDAHQPLDACERDHLSRTREFVARTPRCTSRHTAEGHVTASAWLLAPDETAALLTLHRRLGQWFQPGGHVEADDATMPDAALREAAEESGIDGIVLLGEGVFDVDVHRIPARKGEPSHWHFDVRFLMRAPSREFVVSDESLELAWVRLDAMGGAEASMQRMARKVRASAAD